MNMNSLCYVRSTLASTGIAVLEAELPYPSLILNPGLRFLIMEGVCLDSSTLSRLEVTSKKFHTPSLIREVKHQIKNFGLRLSQSDLSDLPLIISKISK